MKFEEFLFEIRYDIHEFEDYWRKENQKSPDQFPMEFSESDSGMWYEMFMRFIEAAD